MGEQSQDCGSFNRLVSMANRESPGFGDFIVDLETHLTRDTVWKLAMSFDFAEGEIDKIQGADNPNTVLIEFMLKKGQISASNITPLTTKLKYLGLLGIFEKVDSSFKKLEAGSAQANMQDSQASSTGN